MGNTNSGFELKSEATFSSKKGRCTPKVTYVKYFGFKILCMNCDCNLGKCEFIGKYKDAQLEDRENQLISIIKESMEKEVHFIALQEGCTKTFRLKLRNLLIKWNY